ncbi:MAG: tetratricopeptide repeat protein [Acidobacteriia bacterium]|nr:tetratricopeptide repeat protein [Terriglobia bacterium]
MKSKTLALGIGLLVLVGTGCDKLRSRDRLNRGVQAYKSARYADAVDYFKEAVALDPTNLNGRLYLATAYMSQYIPGAESPENLQVAKQAKEEFLRVLEKDSNDKTALASLASLSYQQAQGMPDLDAKLKKLDEAKEWYLKLIAADPQNKEGFYSLGVIDWVKWYAAWMRSRADLGMKPEEPGPLKDKKIKDSLKEQYSAIIEDGIKNLQKALDIDKDYDDAMAYMNLLIRERADLDDTPDQYKKDVDTADGWVQKALDTKKMKAAKEAAKSPGGIVADTK